MVKIKKKKPLHRAVAIKGKIDKRKELLIEAMTKSYGIVASACRAVGCTRDIFYKYYRHDEEFKKKIDNIRELTLDVVEHKLMSLIMEKNITAIIFFLKTQGARRGYCNTNEHKTPIANTVISDKTREILEDLKNGKIILNDKPTKIYNVISAST